jgi:hypothetical protein
MKDFAQGQARDRHKFREFLKSCELETGQSLGDPEKQREFALSDQPNARLRENSRALGSQAQKLKN